MALELMAAAKLQPNIVHNTRNTEKPILDMMSPTVIFAGDDRV